MQDTSADKLTVLEKVTNTKNLVIIGNVNVGKTTLFNRLCGPDTSVVKLPDTQQTVDKGTISGNGKLVYDTPGAYSLFAPNEDEKVSRNLLLSLSAAGDTPGIILVADAKNLKRSLVVALQYAEFGLPMMLAVNMTDEAEARGISIDYEKLSETLGIAVCPTVARNRVGIRHFLTKIDDLWKPKQLVEYPKQVEELFAFIHNLLKSPRISPRAIGLLLLAGDSGIESYLEARYGFAMVEQLKSLAADVHSEIPGRWEMQATSIYNRVTEEIHADVQTTVPKFGHHLLERLGEWCMHIGTGIPIAAATLYILYQFVGSFGATYMVDTINGTFFEGFLIPEVTKLMDYVPNEFVRDMIVDPDFGILPTGVFLALGLVLPVLLCFYIAFGVLEHSGYLPRLSILLNKVFQQMGLNGKGVIPLVMGFSCVTMAILTTRMLDTRKEKNIATFLLLLGMPCAPLLAVMLIILDKMPVSASYMVFGIIGVQILVAGFLANKFMPGKQQSLIMEIPPMRIPSIPVVLKTSVFKTWVFMKDAVPVFIMAALVVFLFERIGGLSALERISKPVVNGFMGLPEKSVQVFIKTIIRRESGATEIAHLSEMYTNLQMIVNLLVMTFLSPCINATIVLFKERGVRAAMVIMATVFVYALTIGGVINHICLFFGITFA
jgi:ferrous iron transport protein B